MKWYPDAKLLFTDTDSLYYNNITEDLEKELFDHKEHFDFSDYPKSSPYYDLTNKKAVGKFKCETKGAPIIEFVGLRPKMYSIQYKDSCEPSSVIKEKHRIKGVTRTAARALLHESYKAQLDFPTENYLKNKRLGSKLHQIYAIEARPIFILKLLI